MIELFEGLPEEKKKRIIDACIEEFANNGYEKASTNAIIKKAGISKGLLFHYFGSKKKVFLYTIDYAADSILKKLCTQCDERPSDLFERMIWASLFKMKMAYEYPLGFKLLFNAFINIPEELKEEMKDRYISLTSGFMPKFFEDIDTSKFRKDIDPKKAIEIVMLFLDGLSNKYNRLYKSHSIDEMLESADKLMEEINEYFAILKSGIYSE